MTTCLGAQPCATREAAEANHASGIMICRRPVAGEAAARLWPQKGFCCSPLQTFPPLPEALHLAHARVLGASARGPGQPTAAPQRSSGRLRCPWSRRHAESSDLRVPARLGGRRDIRSSKTRAEKLRPHGCRETAGAPLAIARSALPSAPEHIDKIFSGAGQYQSLAKSWPNHSNHIEQTKSQANTSKLLGP